ncbi:acetyl-coenzyme-A carboxylase [Coemansia sp. RSA 1804]|nr:acetyl-coenzyme-A carboxylase [Coemansia sp. RSA 1804]
MEDVAGRGGGVCVWGRPLCMAEPRARTKEAKAALVGWAWLLVRKSDVTAIGADEQTERETHSNCYDIVDASDENPAVCSGNSVEAATNSKVRDFVKDHGGHTVITRVLIANNGIAAVKEIRSVRQWAYATFGDERAIEFVVMATPEDLKVNAEYIRMADQYVEVPGGTNNNNYANVELIVDVAERTGAHVSI